RPAWMGRAACHGVTERFYPESGKTGSAVKAICAECPVRQDCLEHALVTPEPFGICGGKSERERRAIRAERDAAGTLPPKAERPIRHDTLRGYERCVKQNQGSCWACRDVANRHQQFANRPSRAKGAA